MADHIDQKEIVESDPLKKDVVTDIESLVGLLTDLGGYCYCTLASVALNMLYSVKDNEHDTDFVEKAVKCITSHLQQPQRVCDTAMAIAKSVEIQHYQPFIDNLKTEDVINTHGLRIVPQDMVVLSLKEGGYDARMRTLIKFMCLILHIKWDEIEEYEILVAKTFEELEHVATDEEKAEKAKKAKVRKIKKIALIGAATVGGGVLIGLTGGLAAPLIATGAAAVVGTAGAAALGSTAGIAIMTSLFGVAGAGLGGYKMNKRIGDVEEFTFEPLTEGRTLNVTIAITGWITDDCPDFTYPWRGLNCSPEQYVLRYESKYLKQMGSAMDYLLSIAVSEATKEALKMTLLSSLVAAIVWPATIIGAAAVIDNPWSVLTNRTEASGKMLAEVLLARQQGRRPVTLIGFSLGARVIYYCLKEMAGRKNCEGIVEDAILLGAPAPGSAKEWSRFKRVVAGKIVNGYCRGDWLLRFLYRTASVQFSIAGLAPIEWRDRRMHNIDLSKIVEGHMDYMNKLDQILEIVGIKTKPRASSGVSANLKEWVDANKQRTLSMVGSKSADAALSTSDINLEFGDDVASTIVVHSKTDPGISTSVLCGNKNNCANSKDQESNYENDGEKLGEEIDNFDDIQLLASLVVNNAVTQAKQIVLSRTSDKAVDDVTESSSSSELLKTPVPTNGNSSVDSGVHSSVTQDEDKEHSSVVKETESDQL